MKTGWRVAGVDGCRFGWIVAILQEKQGQVVLTFDIQRRFSDLLERTTVVSHIAIDMPIGLDDNGGSRLCDKEARRLLGQPRATSVFPVPGRNGGGPRSLQSLAIRPKIMEVDCLMTPKIQERIFEVHPELCFWGLNGGRPLEENKKKKAGYEERLRILETTQELGQVRRFIAEWRRPKDVSRDDIPDAIVAALTALRFSQGDFNRIPEVPALDSKGLRMEMIYPNFSEAVQRTALHTSQKGRQ